MLSLVSAPLLARACFRADIVPDSSVWAATTGWRLENCTSLDLSCPAVGSTVTACANGLQPDEVKPFTEALKASAESQLVSLDLRGSWIGPLGGDGLAKALQGHTSLASLGLGSTALGDLGGASLVRKLVHSRAAALRRLDLSHNHLGDDFARTLSEALRDDDDEVAPLESIDLAWNGISPRGGRYLGDALRVNEDLRELRLRWNGLQDRGARALGEALGLNRALRSLDLEHNSIKDAGGKALALGLRNNSALDTLALERNGLSRKVSDDVAAALEVKPELPAAPSRAERRAAAAKEREPHRQFTQMLKQHMAPEGFVGSHLRAPDGRLPASFVASLHRNHGGAGSMVSTVTLRAWETSVLQDEGLRAKLGLADHGARAAPPHPREPPHPEGAAPFSKHEMRQFLRHAQRYFVSVDPKQPFAVPRTGWQPGASTTYARRGESLRDGRPG